jgi:hypothetical protein
MEMVKRWIILSTFALCMLGLTACTASPAIPATTVPAPTSTSMAVLSTNTLRPTETRIPTPTPTLTPVPPSTPLPTVVRTPYVLTATNPTNLEIALFLSKRHHVVAFQEIDNTGAPFNDFDRKDIDVNNDGQAEIIVSGNYFDQLPYFAVLGRQGNEWRELIFRLDDGRYCADMRTKVEKNTLIVDSLACEGGTGAFIADWNRYWIQCQISTCEIAREVTIWHDVECCTTRPFSETIKLPSGVHYEGLNLHLVSEP